MAAAPASGCANDACSIRLARKIRTIPLLPLFSLSCLSKDCQSPGTRSLHTVEYHRLEEMPTGHEECPSAADEAIGHSQMAGRHCMLPVGRNFLQKTVLTATTDRQCMV